MYDFCENYKIKYNKCGKLVIKQSFNNDDDFDEIIYNANKNGVRNFELNQKQVEEIEPEINTKGAIFFPDSGVFDSHAFMRALEHQISKKVDIVYKTEVKKVKIEDGYLIKIKNPSGELDEITSYSVINASGLMAYEISKASGIYDTDYEVSFWKGEYFHIKNGHQSKIKSLVYPSPNKNITGLGIHTTLDLNNRLKLGPNAVYMGESFKPDFSVAINQKQFFYDAVKNYLPFLSIDDLEPDYAGIRPKLQKPGHSFRDFIIVNEKNRGYNNYINLIGIESPGLTSSLAIGEYVIDIIDRGAF